MLELYFWRFSISNSQVDTGKAKIPWTSTGTRRKSHSYYILGGMPFGLKKREVLVPKLEVIPKAFIRGVFDTDGSVYRKYGPYAQIQFKAASESLMNFIRGHLVALEFHPTHLRPDQTKFRFSLCRQNEVDTFFRTVSQTNPKHLERLRRIRHPDLLMTVR